MNTVIPWQLADAAHAADHDATTIPAVSIAKAILTHIPRDPPRVTRRRCTELVEAVRQPRTPKETRKTA